MNQLKESETEDDGRDASNAGLGNPVFIHISHQGMIGCDHDWENEGSANAFCSKCGISLIAHSFLEMP
jgi:hypothetical protein